MKKKNSYGFLIEILIGIVVMFLIVVGLFATNIINFHTKDSDNEIKDAVNNTEKMLLSNEGALSIGKELYDKVTEMYEVWQLRPYCGLSYVEIYKKDFVKFGLVDGFYDSGFQSLDELKEYLSKWLSQSIIESKVGNEVVTDLSIFEENKNEYTSYVINDGKLYCGSNTGKGWRYRYLNYYDITVQNSEKNEITYNIKSAYPNDSIEFSSNKFEDYNDSQIVYRDTTFVIQKNNNGNWIVTDYTLHD